VNRMIMCKSREKLRPSPRRQHHRDSPTQTDEETDTGENEDIIDPFPKMIVPSTPPAITDNRDLNTSDELELDENEQVRELDHSILDPSWVPTRHQQRAINEREEGYNLRSRILQSPGVRGSISDINVEDKTAAEIVYEHVHREPPFYN
jgi:hypothetical protein